MQISSLSQRFLLFLKRKAFVIDWHTPWSWRSSDLLLSRLLRQVSSSWYPECYLYCSHKTFSRVSWNRFELISRTEKLHRDEFERFLFFPSAWKQKLNSNSLTHWVAFFFSNYYCILQFPFAVQTFMVMLMSFSAFFKSSFSVILHKATFSFSKATSPQEILVLFLAITNCFSFRFHLKNAS